LGSPWVICRNVACGPVQMAEDGRCRTGEEFIQVEVLAQASPTLGTLGAPDVVGHVACRVRTTYARIKAGSETEPILALARLYAWR